MPACRQLHWTEQEHLYGAVFCLVHKDNLADVADFYINVIMARTVTLQKVKVVEVKVSDGTARTVT